MIEQLRMLSDVLTNGRSKLYNFASRMYNGKRDLYRAFGYKRILEPEDYRSRFKRNAVANRIVKALPKATWRGNVELIEDEEIDKTTAFEEAFEAFAKRTKFWAVLARADVLAGINRYSVILIGAPGELDQPLESAGPDEIASLTPYAEEDATILSYEGDAASERFGQPTFYAIKRTSLTSGSAVNSTSSGKKVHWSRVIHIVDGNLDDNIFGEPRLECVWNLLDDLEKVTGSGAEAFWRRADAGMLFDLDPTLDFNEPSKDALKKQLHEYEHDYKRMLLTRGVKVSTLGSNVADFSRPTEAIISQISAGTGIPQRILMGSERGQLASTQDRSNWDDRVVDRRNEWAVPLVMSIVDRFIALGALPAPVEGEYVVRFSAIRVMDDTQRAEIATKWAQLSVGDQPVVTADEIREKVLELPPLEEVISDSPGGGNPQEGDTEEERVLLRAMERAIEHQNPLALDSLVRSVARR